jgi:hypothetical protein
VSKLTESFREVGVYNLHEFYGKGNVYLHFHPSDSRRCFTRGWGVFRPGYPTDPKAHWMDYGNKYFHGGFRGEALVQAQAWAGKRYGIKEWARDPFGGYGDAAFVKARVKTLKAEVAKNKEKNKEATT